MRAFYFIPMEGLTKKQQEIVRFIEKYINEQQQSPSYREIQNYFGFSSLGTVYNHIQVLKRKKVILESKGVRSLNFVKKADNAEQIPLIGKIKGGMPIETFSNIQTVSISPGFLPLSESPRYFLKVEGNTLNEEFIQENDLLLVEPKNFFEEGEKILALVGGNTTFIKKAFYDRPYIRLESVNPEVAPLILREDHVSVQGKIVFLLRCYE